MKLFLKAKELQHLRVIEQAVVVRATAVLRSHFGNATAIILQGESNLNKIYFIRQSYRNYCFLLFIIYTRYQSNMFH